MALCTFYIQNRCQNGEHCRFLHNTAALLPDVGTLQLVEREPVANSAKVCIFHAQGRCLRGSECQYAHVQPSQAPSTLGISHSAQGSLPRTSKADTRSQKSCSFYVKGQCTKGASCPFLHSASEETDEPDVQGHEPTECVRRTHGATVTFGNGGQVLQYSLRADFSAVQISAPVHSINYEAIKAMLTAFDYPVDDCRIRIFETSQGFANATIRAKDSKFAKELCKKLKGQVLDRKYEAWNVQVMNNPDVVGLGDRRTSSRKINISWRIPPPRRVWLNFGNENISQRVSKKFSGGKYKVKGTTVSATDPVEASGTWTPGLSHVNHVPYTVTLNDVPASASKTDIMQVFLPHDKPRHIELNATPGALDKSAVCNRLKHLFTKIGPVDFRERDPTAKRFQLAAYFQDEEDAREAIENYKGKAFDFLGGDKLEAQLIHTAKLTISTSIYNAMSRDISALGVDWKKKDHYVQIRVYDNSDRGIWTVRLEGHNAKDVASATQSLEKIVDGRLLCRNEKPVWFDALSTQEGQYYLRQIQTDLGVIIIRKKGKKELRYYGPDSEMEVATELIASKYGSDRAWSQSIQLNPAQLHWTLRGGLGAIRAIVGNDSVQLDVVAKTLTVRCTGSQFEKAQKAVQDLAPQHSSQTLSTEDCFICFCEAEQPVTLACRHSCCLDCFENMCLTGTGDANTFCIKCMGDEGTCQRVIEIQELQDLLCSTIFEEVLEKSFASHVSRHPNELRNCPTPDCSHIYRVTERPQNISCPGCFSVVCSACHAQHGAVTCSDYRDLQSGGYAAFERFKKEHGIKDCPNCNTPMEKVSGCNHMTCAGCRIHLCWVCLRKFEASGPCYAHMTAAHGGCMDDQDLN